MSLPPTPNPRIGASNTLSVLGAAGAGAGGTLLVQGAYLAGVAVATAGLGLTVIAIRVANREVRRAKAEFERAWEQFWAERG